MGCDSDSESTQLLRALPEDQLPREKLAQNGRASLSDEELIAIFLRTGIQGCNVLELAALLKQRAGSLTALGSLEASEISALCKGIGPAKAATLAAVFELGRRASREQYKRLRMKEAEAVYNYLIDEVRFHNQEHMYVLVLNMHYELLRCVEISQGTLTRLVLHPRDVFREAIRCNAYCIILAHNHPSGYPKPSKYDIELTSSIVKAGEILHIPLLDHIIIGAPSAGNTEAFYSFRDHDMLHA